MTTPANRPDRADDIRMRHRYRRLVMRQRVIAPAEAARRLVGPDCAYHLYRHLRTAETDRKGRKP